MAPSVFVVLASAVAVALVVWAIWYEARRGGRTARRVALGIAVGSLLVLALQPSHEVVVQGTAALLVTPGATPHDLAMVRDAVEHGSSVWVLGRSGFDLPRASELPDLAWLARHRPDISRLKVLGHGLPSWQWESFVGAVEVPPRSAIDIGLHGVTWRREIMLGESWPVTGQVAGELEGVTVRLEGPGGPGDGDVADLGEGGATTFALQARPRAIGRFLYRVVVEVDGAEIAAETLDLTVLPPSRLAVIWLEDAPSFETRHLRTWLMARGGALALRSRISKERFRTEYHGFHEGGPAAPTTLRRLDGELLSDFDVLVSDPETLAGLRRAERKAVATAVRDGGLGLLLRAGAKSAPEDLSDPLVSLRVEEVETTDGVAEMTVQVELPGHGPSGASLSIGARQIILGSDPENPDALPVAHPLAVDRAGRVLAASRLVGRGAVALSLLHDSWRYVLDGQPEDHGRLWSRLLGAVARRSDGALRWWLPPGPARIGELLEIVVEVPGTIEVSGTIEAPGAIEASPRAVVRGEGGEPVARLALAEDTSVPGRWRARFWPRASGWHRFILEGAAEESGVERAGTWIWVAPANTWPAWEQTRNQNATRRAAVLRDPPPENVAIRRMPWPRWPFYLLFLGAVAFLWVDERGGRMSDGSP